MGRAGARTWHATGRSRRPVRARCAPGAPRAHGRHGISARPSWWRAARRVRRSPAYSSCTALPLQPGFAARLRERAYAPDIARAFGGADDPARVEQVEQMTRLDALVVGGQRERRLAIQQRPALVLGVGEVGPQPVHVRALEVERAVFALGAQEHVAVSHASAVEIEVIDPL